MAAKKETPMPVVRFEIYHAAHLISKADKLTEDEKGVLLRIIESKS